MTNPTPFTRYLRKRKAETTARLASDMGRPVPEFAQVTQDDLAAAVAEVNTRRPDAPAVGFHAVARALDPNQVGG